MTMMRQSQSFRCFSIVFNKSKAEHSSLSSQFYYLCAITIQFQGLAEMDFVCFKVLKTSKQGNLEEGRGKNILVCTLSSTQLVPPQVATLALSTAISVLTDQSCRCSLYCSVIDFEMILHPCYCSCWRTCSSEAKAVLQ